MNEIELVKERYERRKAFAGENRYSLLNAVAWQMAQEKERVLIGIINRFKLGPLEDKRLLEVGCGDGSNLLECLRLGFSSQHLAGNELLPHFLTQARERLPKEVALLLGDASQLDLPPASYDIVFQSTVFTSILDLAFQKHLAGKMWELARPGGGVLWYDFVYDNPRNPDVRGIKPARIRELFPDGRLYFERVTLAPPIARAVVGVHPALYTLFNCIPLLRTHMYAWIQKPA